MMKEDIKKAAQILREGGIVAHPTDTCYGLAVDVQNEKALKKVYNSKKMALDKPISVLVRSIEEAREYGEFSELAERLAREFWPGALTLVVPRRGGKDFVGLRVIDEPITNALLEEFGGPVTTTSANLSGEATPFNAFDITAQVDFVLDGGPLEEYGKASTVIKVEGEEATVLRWGALDEIGDSLDYRGN